MQVSLTAIFDRGLNKSGVFAAFVLLLSLFVVAPEVHAKAPAAQVEAASHHQWHALIHSRAGQPQIKDASFLLSAQAFSPLAELQATLQLLHTDTAALCRFPARATWLAQRGLLPMPSLAHCPEVVELRQRAPVDQVEVLFASESITSPASMLGHVFLGLSGQTAEGQRVDHAVSFFTRTETWNYPKLLFDSLVTGKQGFFALGPLDTALSLYLHDEQRTVWRYPVKFSAQQRDVFALHLLELKQTTLTYYFQNYNCATLVHFLLSLGDRPLPDYSQWMTPKDIVRQLVDADMAGTTTVAMPSRALARMLASDADVRGLAELVMDGQLASWQPPADGQGYLQLAFAQSYNRYAGEAGKIPAAQAQVNDAVLREQSTSRFQGYAVSPDARFEPTGAPQETQWLAQLHRRGGRNGLDLTFRPVSHELDDDNRSYAAETEMQLLSPTVRLENDRVRLDRFVVYGMRSLLPYDSLLGGTSSQFKLAMDKQWSALAGWQRFGLITVGVGRTLRWLPDLDIYALANAGAGVRRDQAFAFASVDTGLIVRAIWDSKLTFEVSRAYNEAASHHTTDRAKLTLTHYVSRSFSVRTGGVAQRQATSVDRQAHVGFTWIY